MEVKEFFEIDQEVFVENLIQSLFASHLQAFLPNDIPFMSEINLETLSHGHFLMNSPIHNEYLAIRNKIFKKASDFFTTCVTGNDDEYNFFVT